MSQEAASSIAETPTASHKAPTIHIDVDLSPSRLVPILSALGGLALVVLGGTWYFTTAFYAVQNTQGEPPPLLSHGWAQFNLAAENNLATWFSSQLLLLTALSAAFCFVLDRRYHSSHHRLHYGWLIYAAIFAVLSLDEIGSLHERIGMLVSFRPAGGQALGWEIVLAPVIGLVALFMGIFTLVHVRRAPLSLLLSGLGILLFLTIPVQEAVESTLRAAAGGVWQRPVLHILLEEGAELFGTLAFLSAAVAYATRVVAANAPDSHWQRISFQPPLRTFYTVLLAWLFVAVLGMIGIQFSMAYLQAGEAGVAANWFVSSLATQGALLYLLLWGAVAPAGQRERLLYLAHVGLSLAVSAYYGANLYQWQLAEQRHLVYLGFYGLILVLAMLLILHMQERWSRIGVSVWVGLLAMSLVLKSLALPLAFGAFAVLLLTLPQRLRAGTLPPGPPPRDRGWQQA